MGPAARLPTEPIVALDDINTDEALQHPLELATETIVESFADDSSIVYLAAEGHKRQFVRAVVNMYRQLHRYEVHELHDFKCVALVREVPEEEQGTHEEEEEEEEEEAKRAGQREGSRPDASRAAASANVEGGSGEQQGAMVVSSSEVDVELVREAVQKGSLNSLLALGVPRLQAEMLVHIKPERLQDMQQIQEGLEAIMQQYMQTHGPLLHLHFLATMPGQQGSGWGRSLMQHLERMADAEGKHLYLEASSEESRRLYLRHGFQEVQRFDVGGEGGVPLFIMARPPGAKSAPEEEEAEEAGAGKQAAERMVEGQEEVGKAAESEQ